MTELPPHWSSLALGELCSSVEKVDPTNLGRDDFWYVDIGALEPSSSSLEKVINIPTANAPGRARQLIRNGDSIFATVRPYMKKVAYIPKEFDGQIASTGFCVLRPIQEKLHSKYLFYFYLPYLFKKRSIQIIFRINFQFIFIYFIDKDSSGVGDESQRLAFFPLSHEKHR